MIASVLLLMCVATADPVDAAIEQANRFSMVPEHYAGVGEDLTAAREAVFTLMQLAEDCPDEQWPEMRAKLVEGLSHENRGVWLACFSALCHREGEDGASLYFEQINSSTDPVRVQIATKKISRLARKSSDSFKTEAIIHLGTAVRDFSRPMDRGTLITAIGAMGPMGTIELNTIRNDPFINEHVRDQLPFAYAATGDPAAISPLLELMPNTPESGRSCVPCILALGNLLRNVQQKGMDQFEPARSDTADAVALLRNFLFPNAASSPETAASASLALSRAGFFWNDPDCQDQAWELLQYPEAREKVLRVIFENRGRNVPEDTVQYIKNLAQPVMTMRTPVAMDQSRRLAGAIVEMWEMETPETE